jgi:hypothetical protein
MVASMRNGKRDGTRCSNPKQDEKAGTEAKSIPAMALLSRCFLSGIVPKPSFPFPTETTKMSRFPLLMISQGCGQFVVGSGSEFFSNVAECAEIIAPVQPLSFQTFENFKHERECPIQVIDGFVKMSLYAMVKATALGLRRKDGAFNVLISHCASNAGARVRAASML